MASLETLKEEIKKLKNLLSEQNQEGKKLINEV